MHVSRIIILLVAASLIFVGIISMRTLDRTDSPVATEVLNVDQVAKNPSAFAGQEIDLSGVVSAVVPAKQLFAVIDLAEYASCRVVSCSQYQIPIAYAGDLPDVETPVTVTGHLTEPEPGRFLFQATSVELNQ